MANPWTYEEKFNSDTKSLGNLDGQDGWTGSTEFQVVDSPVLEGDQCVKGATSDNVNILVDIGETKDSGELYFDFETDQASAVYYIFALRNYNNEVEDVLVYFRSSNRISARNDNIAWVDVGNWVQNTKHRIGIKFRCSGADPYEGLGEREYLVNVDGGEWQGPFAFGHVDGVGIRYISLQTAAANTGKSIYFDFISPVYSTTNIKSINGLAKASIKSINGLAIASVKSFNGLS